MSAPQNTPASNPVRDLDARIAALEKYLAEPPPSSSRSVEFVGGTVIHIPHVGRLNVPRDADSWAGVILVALLIVATSVLFFLRRAKTQTHAA